MIVGEGEGRDVEWWMHGRGENGGHEFVECEENEFSDTNWNDES
jgi:hypothetical protein